MPRLPYTVKYNALGRTVFVSMLNLNSDLKNKETILIPAATPQQKLCYTKLIFGNSLKLFSLQIQLPLTCYRRR